MEITAKYFNELTTAELYEILQARSRVFVVEQNCIYLDQDGRDAQSLHVSGWENGRLTAYLRAFTVEGNPSFVQLGRVLTLRRGAGLGSEILQAGIRLCREKLQAKEIRLEAQCYAVGYYEKAGFTICSEEFLDDGIPHVWMRRAWE